jgi:AcrR family transcriptional regulator
VPRPKIHDDALRVRLLDEAGRLLSTEGPAALSLRRLATDVGTSTTAVYSLFGGKSGLVRALFLEAFGRLGRHLSAVPVTADPAEDIVRLGLAYRASALAAPHMYSVMFGRPVPEFEPEAEDTRDSLTTMDPLINAVRAGMAKGALLPCDPQEVVLALWGVVHGLVSLELRNVMLDGIDLGRHYERALRAAVRGWSQW